MQLNFTGSRTLVSPNETADCDCALPDSLRQLLASRCFRESLPVLQSKQLERITMHAVSRRGVRSEPSLPKIRVATDLQRRPIKCIELSFGDSNAIWIDVDHDSMHQWLRGRGISILNYERRGSRCIRNPSPLQRWRDCLAIGSTACRQKPDWRESRAPNFQPVNRTPQADFIGEDIVQTRTLLLERVTDELSQFLQHHALREPARRALQEK